MAGSRYGRHSNRQYRVTRVVSRASAGRAHNGVTVPPVWVAASDRSRRPEEVPVRLGMVSAYSPRRCAAAAVATDLGRALSPEFDLVVCALDRYGLSYPPEVAAVIHEDEHDDYRRAARVLAEYEVDAVLVQYDDSNFGGPLVLDLAHE